MYAKILVPVDLSHGKVGERILAVARHMAGPSGKIVLLSVLEAIPGFVASSIPAATIDANRNDAIAKLHAMARSAGADVDVALREGKPSAEILAEAEACGADAIVLGSHRPNFSDYLLGSTAARVVRHAQCSVIVDRALSAAD